jgi:hypothetical protein
MTQMFLLRSLPEIAVLLTALAVLPAMEMRVPTPSKRGECLPSKCSEY